MVFRQSAIAIVFGRGVVNNKRMVIYSAWNRSRIGYCVDEDGSKRISRVFMDTNNTRKDSYRYYRNISFETDFSKG